MRRRASHFLSLVAVLALVGSACAQQQTGGGGEETIVKLAFVGAETGPYTPLVIHAIRAARLAIDEANDSGDLDNVRIVFSVFDSQASPDQAVTLADQFLPEEDFIGLMGPAFSGESRAILPSLQEEGLVMISPSATATQLPFAVCGEDATECDKATVFHRVVPDDDVQGQAVSDYVTKVLKFTTMAYAHDNTDYGKGVAEGTRDLLTKAGVTAAVTATIDPNAQIFSDAVNQIIRSRAPAVFYGGYAPQAGPLAKQLKDAGYTGKFISGDGSLDQAFVKAAGTGGEGSLLTCACRLAGPTSEGELGDMAKRYKEKYGLDPGVYAGEGWDAAQIFIAGIKAGNTTRKKMHDYVEKLTTIDYALSKEVEFLENGNQKPTDVFVHEVKDGKITLLGTIAELAT